MRKTWNGIKGGYCSVSDYKKGMGLIIKGDGSVFDHSIKDTATTSGGCVAVFCGQHFYAALSGLRCLVFQPYTAATYG